MQKVKEIKKSSVVGKLGKQLWDKYEKEWEEENQPGTSKRLREEILNAEHDEADVNIEELPFLYVLEDDEDCLESDDEDDSREEKKQAFKDGLRTWALRNKITHHALNELLVLIRETTDFVLPKDSKTFLKTPDDVGKELECVAGGKLWYQGIQKSLQYYYREVTPTVNIFHINISMDGIPLHNSGPTQLWPISIQLYNITERPVLIVAVYCGPSKPGNAEGYLRSFVTELNYVQEQGVVINGKHIDIQIRAILADSPARAFIKGVAYHNGTHGCMKCDIMTTHVRSARKMVYDGIGKDRTDAEFRSGVYANTHQKRQSPLLDVNNIDIIQDVPVGDPLHLLDLGMTRKILNGYVNGTLKPFPKWLSFTQEEISHVVISTQLPSEIARKLRSLKYLPFWKGTELSSFLHYASIPVLQNRISDEAFRHFKLYYTAVTILSSKYHEPHWKYAGELLKIFVEQFSSIYDRSHMTSNVHNLLHIASEVYRFGPLPTLSTYPFENKLQFIKRLVRGGSRHLEQVVCRLVELREIDIAEEGTDQLYPYVKTKGETVVLHVRAGFKLKEGDRDGWCLTNEHVIIKYNRVTELSGSLFIIGNPILEKQPTFIDPCDSGEIILNFKADQAKLSTSTTTVLVTDIKCKLAVVTLEQGSTFYFTPLLHTLT